MPNALALVEPIKVPACTVVPPPKVALFPASVSDEVRLFSITSATLPPSISMMVLAAVPTPLFVIVPELLIDAPDRVIAPAPVALSIRLPVPEMLPLKVRVLATGDSTKS